MYACTRCSWLKSWCIWSGCWIQPLYKAPSGLWVMIKQVLKKKNLNFSPFYSWLDFCHRFKNSKLNVTMMALCCFKDDRLSKFLIYYNKTFKYKRHENNTVISSILCHSSSTVEVSIKVECECNKIWSMWTRYSKWNEWDKLW